MYHLHKVCWMCSGRKTLSAYERDVSAKGIPDVFRIVTEGWTLSDEWTLNQGRQMPNGVLVFITSERQCIGLMDANALMTTQRYYTVRKMDEEGFLTVLSDYNQYVSRSGAYSRLWKEVEKLRGAE